MNNQARNAEIIRRRKAGEWPAAIAKTLGLSRNTVIGVCNRAGLSGHEGRSLVLRGEQVAGAILSEAAVRAIRRDYVPRHPAYCCRALAERFGVDRRTVWGVIAGDGWAHVK